MAKTIAEQLAAEAKQLTFNELPPEVVRQVKRLVLDALGCAFGAYLSEPSKVVQGMIKEMGGPAESTVFGSGVKTSCLNACLANGAMVKYLDYNDRSFLTQDARHHTGHHGESIPGILAVGERQHTNGQEIITAIVLAYELLNKIFDSIDEDEKWGAHTGYDAILSSRGWTHETMRTPCVMGLVTGRLLGLTELQMAHALAFAGSFNFELGIVNWCEEQLTMARNMKFPCGTYGGILGAFLAKNGFTGPLNIFEGRQGIAEVVTGGTMKLEKLTQPRTGWTILNTWVKRYSAGGVTQGVIDATLTLVKEHDIKAEDVSAVKISTTSLTKRILGNADTRRDPKTKESADHSSYYTAAAAILHRAVGPDQFTEEKRRDPRVRELIDKMSIEPDPKLDKFASPGSGPAIVEIMTKNGKAYRCEVRHPKGHPLNPMTEADVEEKFRSMAGKLMTEQQMRQIVDTVYNLDKLDDIGNLLKVLVIKGQDSRG